MQENSDDDISFVGEKQLSPIRETNLTGNNHRVVENTVINTNILQTYKSDPLAADHSFAKEDGCFNVLIVATASPVLSNVLPKLVRTILALNDNVRVRIIIDEDACRYQMTSELENKFLRMGVYTYRDEHQWQHWKHIKKTVPDLNGIIGSPDLVCELRNWADILVFAPLNLNTITQIALGLCKNLLLTIIRGWDNAKPILIAPALPIMQANSTLTKMQLQLIRSNYNCLEELQCIPCVGSHRWSNKSAVEDINIDKVSTQKISMPSLTLITSMVEAERKKKYQVISIH